MGVYDSYYQGIYASQRPSVYQQQQFAAWLLQQQLQRLRMQSVSNQAQTVVVNPPSRPRLRNERFEVVESRAIKLAAATARRAARKAENRVHGSPRASPSGTLRYEYGLYAEKYGPIKALNLVRRHFESLGYKTNIPYGSPRASEEATLKYMRELEREFASKVSVEELSGYLKPVPVTGSRIPRSTTLNPDSSDKRLTTVIDKYVEAPSKAFEASIIKPVEAWVRERAGEKNVVGVFVGSLGLSGAKFLQGVYEGATSIVRPWSLADSIGAAVKMGPRGILEYYARNPLEVSRLAGGFAGGYLVGGVAGRLYSGLRARFGKPDYSGEFELVPRGFEKLKVEVAGRQGFLVRRMTYVEKGVARPVYSLSREQGLIGEYSIRGMRSGDYGVFIGEGYRLLGRELFRVPIRSGSSTVSVPENVFGTGYRIYGFEKPGSPIIYSFEKVFYRGKPVHFSGRILTNVRVFEHRPGFLVRAAYWIGRKLGLTNKVPKSRFSYEGLGAGKTIDYVIDLRGPAAGGVSTGSLVQGFAKPGIRVRVPVFINRNFGELTGLLGGLSVGPRPSISRGFVKSFNFDIIGPNSKSSSRHGSLLNVKGVDFIAEVTRTMPKIANEITPSMRLQQWSRNLLKNYNMSINKQFLSEFSESASKATSRSTTKQLMLQMPRTLYALMNPVKAESKGKGRSRLLLLFPTTSRGRHRIRKRTRRVRERYFERVNPFNI